MENYEPVVRERRNSKERLGDQYGAGKQAAAYLGKHSYRLHMLPG